MLWMTLGATIMATTMAFIVWTIFDMAKCRDERKNPFMWVLLAVFFANLAVCLKMLAGVI